MLNFSTKRGDTFAVVPFQINKDGLPLNLTGAIIRMQLRKSPGGTIYLNLTSVSNLGITITNGLNGAFKINEMILNLEPNVYLYDIEIIFPSGEVKTWISGQVTVINDITR
jgi:hypothetical protein